MLNRRKKISKHKGGINSKNIFVILLILSSLILTSCSLPGTEPMEEEFVTTEPTTLITQEPTKKPEPPQKKPKEMTIEQMVQNMSMDEKIGQLLLIDFRQWKNKNGELYDVRSINQDIIDIISKYHIGNVILFGENTKTTKDTVKLTYELQKAAITSGNLPLLIGIDQEGGEIVRLGEGCRLPGNMAIGASKNPQLALEAGELIAKELQSNGINCDFAPDADVNDEPKNPIIGLRSFGQDPSLVGDMVQHMVEGIQGQGIISCVKHFPGHGNTTTDTHTGLAIVNKKEAEWEHCEKVPFENAIKQGVPMIMTAHIQYPGLDDTKVTSELTQQEIYLPATLSHKILTGLLRKQMGFDGVIITDALNMKAITDHFGTTKAVIKALEAGADMLCNPTNMRSMDDVKQLDDIYTAIKKAVDDHVISQDELDEKVIRILKMKQKYHILDKKRYDEPLEEKVEQAQKVTGGTEHRELERKIAFQCVVWAQGNKTSFIDPKKEQNVLVLMPQEKLKNSVDFAVNRLEQEGYIQGVNVTTIDYEKQQELSEELQNAILTADTIILGSEMTSASQKNKNHWMNQMPEQVLEYIKENNKDNHLILLCAGLPYQSAKYTQYPCILCNTTIGMEKKDAESGHINGSYGPNIVAAIEKIFGMQE